MSLSFISNNQYNLEEAFENFINNSDLFKDGKISSLDDIQKLYTDLFKMCLTSNVINPIEYYELLEEKLAEKTAELTEDDFTLGSNDYSHYRFIKNDTVSEYKLNKNHINIINSLSEDQYNHILDSISNDINKSKMKNMDDVYNKVNQLKALNGIRSKRSVFSKIGDFFTGRMFRERKRINVLKSNIIENANRVIDNNTSEKNPYFINNVIYSLNSKDLYDANIVLYDVDVTQNIKDVQKEREEKAKKNGAKISPFNHIDDKKLIESKKLTKEQLENNLEYLIEGIDFYHDIKDRADSETRNKHIESIVEKCALMGISRESALKAIDKKDIIDIKYELAHGYYEAKKSAVNIKNEEIEEVQKELDSIDVKDNSLNITNVNTREIEVIE